MIVSLESQLLQRLSRSEADATAAAEQLNADLATAVHRTALMRRLFYAAVLAVALYGTTTGAVVRFGLPWPVAIGGIFALELGGVVFLSNAEVRRRLGEHAVLSRLLGMLVASAAATFNMLTHTSPLLGGFFALMSALGFLAWWLDVENKRRDRLRARGQLAAATPAYELWDHWLRHPFVTRRARGFAKAYPQLGLYGSLEAALTTMRREKRNAALAAALRKRIRTAVSKDMADIAVLTFDIDEVAARLRDGADYDGLSALLGSELTAERMLNGHNDDTAIAARAWLARQRHYDPQPISTLPNSDIDDTDVDTPTPTSVLPHTPRTPDTPVSIPTPRPDLPNGITVHPTPTDPPAAPAQSPHTPRVRHHSQLSHAAADLSSTQPDEDDLAPATVNIRVLGAPAVLDSHGHPVRGLRTKSIELLAYLAIRRNGASPSDILAAIWPNVTPERAPQRLSTCLTNLRNIIRQTHRSNNANPNHSNADTPVDPIVNIGGTYQLDPAIITVDWWQTIDNYAPATNNTDPAQWQHTIDNALDNLAPNSDYPWLDAQRQRTRHDLALPQRTPTDPNTPTRLPEQPNRDRE